MKKLITTIIKGLVENPSEVTVTEDLPTDDGITTYHVRVDVKDVGRVVGKEGRIIKAIRLVCRSAAMRNDTKINIIVD